MTRRQIGDVLACRAVGDFLSNLLAAPGCKTQRQGGQGCDELRAVQANIGCLHLALQTLTFISDPKRSIGQA